MSVSPDQLTEIQRQLRDFFDSHPAVTIKPIKGNPPEQYEITYNIAGYTNPGKGEPRLSTQHQIELAIPFGFPHFPPSCKPKSDIFHPDFDPAAICLGDFWQQTRQVTDLIIFIGKLINGESYTTSNAFNEQAAAWYQRNSSSFPIAEIRWSDKPITPAMVRQESKAQIDTLEDDDLSPDFSFPAADESSSDEELTLNTSFPSIETPSAGVDIELLQLLESQKRFFKIRKILEKGSNFPDKIEAIASHAEEAIAKAEELHRSATKAEYQENFQNATHLYELIGSLVVDFPNLDADQKRALDAETRHEKFDQDAVPDFDDSEFAETSDDDLVFSDQASAQASPKIKADSPAPKRLDSFISPSHINSKTIITLTAGLLGIILTICGIYYLISIYQFDSANTTLKQCKALVDQEQFENAKQSCEDASKSLSNIKYFQKGRTEGLQADIEAILKSENLSQGLAGNILVDGKYLPKNEAHTLNSYKKLLKEGEVFFDQENWAQAENRFAGFLAVAGKNTFFSPSIIADIKGKLSFARFSIAFNSANALLNDHKWQEATAELKKAKIQLETLPEQDRQKYSTALNSAIAKLNFEEFRKKGDDFFSKADWMNAVSSYKSVLPSLLENNVAPQETIDALRENINRAELYATIDKGNKASASSQWDEAIQEYTKANSILAASQEIFKTADSQITRRKLDRIILQTIIIRDRQAAKSQQEEKKDLVAARATYRQLVTSVNNSGFATEDEFLEVKKASAAAIQTLDEKIYQGEKEQHLKDNFRALFTENYPASIPEKLGNPVVVYVKEVDGKMIFKMQCTETGRGRPLTLVMFYSYDKSSKHWSFYSEKP
jgi:ubiquitin-protein ligase